MKYIKKGGCPHVYSRWCASVAGTDKEDYNEVPAAEKRALLDALIHEQGWLCAYTMRRIDESSCHIEHIKPRSVCRAEGPAHELDYGNLVACFPREGMKRAYRYGAQQKADWWANDGIAFVSPLHEACEQRFRFDLAGRIHAVRNHRGAVTTIGVLALDHRSLREDCKRVIEELVFGENGISPLSPAKAAQAALEICERDGSGRFHQFCIAIQDALEDYLKLLRRRAQRRKAARRKS